jgi:hypothetical protein
VLFEIHGFEVAGVPDPVNCVVEFMHAESVPEIMGRVFITTVPLAELLEQLGLPVVETTTE